MHLFCTKTIASSKRSNRATAIYLPGYCFLVLLIHCSGLPLWFLLAVWWHMDAQMFLLPLYSTHFLRGTLCGERTRTKACFPVRPPVKVAWLLCSSSPGKVRKRQSIYIFFSFWDLDSCILCCPWTSYVVKHDLKFLILLLSLKFWNYSTIMSSVQAVVHCMITKAKGKNCVF